MEFYFSACFLQFRDFGDGLSNLFYFQFVNCSFQILQLKVHPIQFVENELIFLHFDQIASLIFFFSKAINISFFLLLMTNSALKLLKKALSCSVVRIQFFLEPANLESHFIVILIYAREDLLKSLSLNSN